MNYNNIRLTIQNGGSLSKLISLNVLIFVVVNIFLLLLRLFNFDGSVILSYLAVPADLSQLLQRIWTPVTYMFLHENLFHVLFNMLALYWFGKLFLMFYSQKQLVGIYVVGGLFGAFIYIVSYQLFPFYSRVIQNSILLGASGSIMAIIVASAVRSPNIEMQLMFVGAVKLKYIAIVSVLISLFGITSSNGGGELAHLGGALAGYLFVVSLQKGVDITGLITKIFDVANGLFRPRKLKVKKSRYKTKPMSDAEFNIQKAKKMAEIDRILDKIKSSGYSSLTPDEKKQLFEQGNRGNI